MKRTRRNHGATFKAQVALAAIKGDKTLAEFAEPPLFVTHYNTRKYHESLNNLTSECVFTGQHEAVLKTRNEIKRATIALRKKLHAERRAAYHTTRGAGITPYLFTPTV